MDFQNLIMEAAAAITLPITIKIFSKNKQKDPLIVQKSSDLQTKLRIFTARVSKKGAIDKMLFIQATLIQNEVSINFPKLFKKKLRHGSVISMRIFQFLQD